MHIATRENAIVNRLNKTKEERVVDHEQERVDRIKAANAMKRAAALEKVALSLKSLFRCLILYPVRKRKMPNFPSRERQRRRLGHMICWTTLRKTKALQRSTDESWKKTSCNWKICMYLGIADHRQ